MEEAYYYYCKGKAHNKYVVKYDVESLKHVKNIVKPILPRSVENYPLVSLIDRYINPQNYQLYNNLKVLQGPLSIFYMTSHNYPHKICLMGDKHSLIHEKTRYVQGHEFVFNYINNSPKFIDVFIEEEYKKIDMIDPENDSMLLVFTDSYLDRFLNLIPPDCYALNKSKCYLDTTRIHYTDLRLFFTTNFDKFYSKLMNSIVAIAVGAKLKTLNNATIVNSTRKIKNSFENNIDIITNIKEINILLAKKTEIVKKQIKNIPNNVIKNYISDLLNNNPIHKDEFILKRSPLSLLFNQPDEVFLLSLFSFAKNYIIYVSHILDVYLFARLFRTFNDTGYKYSEPSFNSFIYMGNSHVLRYKKWLSNLGFSLEFEKEDNGGILDITELKQPLFMSA